MTTAAHTLTDTTLTQRAQQLKHWFIDAFREAEDSDDIEYALSKLVKGRPDAENADDQYILRVLQHPSILPTHVYTLLALLLRRRGGPIPSDPFADDEELLARAVAYLSHTPTYGLHRSMMCFTGLFGSGEMALSDRLIGVRDAATALYSMDEDAKRVSVEIVQRISAVAGDAREEVSNILGEVVEKMLQEMVSTGSWGSTGSAVALDERTSVVPLTEETRLSEIFTRSGLTARQFVWTYRAVEQHIRFVDSARELSAEIEKSRIELSRRPCWEEIEECKQLLVARRNLKAFVSRERSALRSGEWDEEDLEECEKLLRVAEGLLGRTGWREEPDVTAGKPEINPRAEAAEGVSERSAEAAHTLNAGSVVVQGRPGDDTPETFPVGATQSNLTEVLMVGEGGVLADVNDMHHDTDANADVQEDPVVRTDDSDVRTAVPEAGLSPSTSSATSPRPAKRKQLPVLNGSEPVEILSGSEDGSEVTRLQKKRRQVNRAVPLEANRLQRTSTERGGAEGLRKGGLYARGN